MATNAYNILIVEDEGVTARHIQTSLKSMGYNVAGAASNGEEAIARVIETRPDLILMDIELSGNMDGIETSEHIRLQCDAPIIYLTAHSNAIQFQRAQATEPSGFIVKPFEDGELRANIEMAMHHYELKQALQVSETRYRLLIENITDAVFLADLKLRPLYINSAVTRLFGYKLEEMQYIRWDVILAPEAVPKVEQLLTKVMALARTAKSEEDTAAETMLEARRKDGGKCWIEIKIKLLRDALARPFALLGIIRDVTEQMHRRALETEYKQQREQLLGALQNVLSRTPLGCVHYDREFRVISWDATAEKIFGFRAADVLGSLPSESYLPAKAGPLIEELRRRMTTEAGAIQTVCESITRDGRMILCEWFLTPLKDEQGDFSGFLGMVRMI